MNGGILQLALIGLLGALLVAAAVTDLRSRTIANGLTGAVALLAPAYWLASGLSPWPEMAIQLGLGLAVFGLFAVAFRFGWMGGGDVKLLGALALWLPLFSLGRMIVAMALIGGVLTLAFVALHKLRKAAGPVEVPYGVAIACGGLFAVFQPYFQQFA